MDNDLIIQEAYEHNLKRISLRLPKNKLIVVTGPSGSGKSSLVYDTIFMESQRLFFESLALYSKSYIRLQEPAKVKSISHLCPGISVDQKTRILSHRSTVGTVSEILDYLRLLYARFGQNSSDYTAPVVSRRGFEQIWNTWGDSKSVWIAAPWIENRKGTFQQDFQALLRQGVVYVWVDGERVLLTPDLALDRHKKHTIYVLIEKLKTSSIPTTQKISEMVQQARQLKASELICLADGQEMRLSISRSDQGITAGPKLEPHHFSFNNPFGQCKACKGLGEDELGVVCSECEGCRVNPKYGSVQYRGASFKSVCLSTLSELHARFKQLTSTVSVETQMLQSFLGKLHTLSALGLGYLPLVRSAATLSGGETQRLRIGSLINGTTSGLMYVLDEPSIGLHPMNTEHLLQQLKNLAQHNAVIVVEHDLDTIRASDYLVELGPGGGQHGGTVVYGGPTQKFLTAKRVKGSQLHAYVAGQAPIPAVEVASHPQAREHLVFKNIVFRNLKIDHLQLPLGRLVGIAGVSGSGKSSLLFDYMIPQLKEQACCVYEVTQEPIGKSSRSTVATYLEIYQFIRQVFSASISARTRGLSQREFSFNASSFRCETCHGLGYQRFELSFLPQSEIVCERCHGDRFQDFVLRVRYKDKNIGDVLDMTLEEATQFFYDFSKVAKPLHQCLELGLGYLKLGQLTSTLSGGEAQRLKLIYELSKRHAAGNIYCLDEPTTGLSAYDIQFLLKLFSRLIIQGNSIFVIEHHPTVIASSHHILELGPGGGPEGGQVIAQGSPQEIKDNPNSLMSRWM